MANCEQNVWPGVLGRRQAYSTDRHGRLDTARGSRVSGGRNGNSGAVACARKCEEGAALFGRGPLRNELRPLFLPCTFFDLCIGSVAMDCRPLSAAHSRGIIAALLATAVTISSPQPTYCPPRVVVVYRVPRPESPRVVYRSTPQPRAVATPRMESPGWYESIKTIEPLEIQNRTFIRNGGFAGLRRSRRGFRQGR